MKVLIVEDEQPAVRKLVRLLEEVDPAIVIIGVLSSVEQVVNGFSVNTPPDLVFMDIQLEDGISFEVFDLLEIKIPVIFTTAYDEYALKAFKVNSVDYLLKPVGLEELKKAVDKFNAIHRLNMGYTRLEAIIKELYPVRKERFMVKIGEHYRSVPVSAIRCFYIAERSTFIFDDTGKNHPVDYSLDKIGQLVDPALFFRVNRNFIIAYNSIGDIINYSSNRLKIILYGWDKKENILVSRERVALFKAWIDR